MAEGTIGDALLARRVKLGLDKGRAASRIGMSRTTYGSYERDTQRPSIEVFPALIDFLGISLEEFLVLYGATCIAIARASFTEPASTTESRAGDTDDGVPEASSEAREATERSLAGAHEADRPAPEASLRESASGAEVAATDERTDSVRPIPEETLSKLVGQDAAPPDVSREKKKSKKRKHKKRH